MTFVSNRCAIVGAGRVGTAMTAALTSAGWAIEGPLGRGADPQDHDIVLLCVPDDQIAAAATAVTTRPGRLVGHCSGACTLAPLVGHEAFSLHPLMTVTGPQTRFEGVPAAIAGSTPRALAVATALAAALGLDPFTVPDDARAAYHAAASLASNYLLTLLWTAERIGDLDRHRLAPLVRATVANWERAGAADALTGPVARGDEQTVLRQTDAVADRDPASLELFAALTERTRALATEAVA